MVIIATSVRLGRIKQKLSNIYIQTYGFWIVRNCIWLLLWYILHRLWILDQFSMYVNNLPQKGVKKVISNQQSWLAGDQHSILTQYSFFETLEQQISQFCWAYCIDPHKLRDLRLNEKFWIFIMYLSFKNYSPP